MVAFPTLAMPTPGEIAAEVRPIVYERFNAHIQVFDPKQSVTTPYDPATDTGGTTVPLIVFDSGVNGARIQPIKATNKADFGGQNVKTLSVRFQTLLDADLGFRAGLRIRVLDGGEDKSLERYLYTVDEGINSSYAWNRTIETTVDLTQYA